MILTDHRHAITALRHLRQARGLTQAQLAAVLHVHRKTVCYRENGQVGLHDADLITTAGALGFDVALVPARHPGARPTGTGWPA